jgi:hypothetical protein
MNDLGTLCLVGIFVIVGLMLLSRFMGGGMGRGGTDFSQRGPEQRTVDNPEVRSRGFFGGRSQSGSSSRSSGGSLFSGTRRTSSGRADNSEVRSRGGFGRNKD